MRPRPAAEPLAEVESAVGEGNTASPLRPGTVRPAPRRAARPAGRGWRAVTPAALRPVSIRW